MPMPMQAQGMPNGQAWMQMLRDMQRTPSTVDQAADAVAARGPASIPLTPEMAMGGLGGVDPAMEAQPSQAMMAAPAVQNLYPAMKPYEIPEEQKAVMKQIQDATTEQLNKQKGGIGKLEQLLADRRAKYSGINFSPLAAYIDSNIPGSHMLPGAEAMNRENEKTDQLQKDIQGAENQMSKDYLSNLGEQLKAAQFGAQMAHQQRVDSAQQQKAANALITSAERTWNNDKVLGMYTLRMDGAKNILNIVDELESAQNSRLPEKEKLKLTAPLITQIYNELGRLETGSQAVAQGLIHEGAQPLFEADFKKLRTYFTGNVPNMKIPESINQARLLLGHMMGNYTKAIDRRGKVLSNIGGISPIQQAVFDAKAKETIGQYGSLVPKSSKQIDDVYQVGDTGTHSDGSIWKKVIKGPDSDIGNWKMISPPTNK